MYIYSVDKLRVVIFLSVFRSVSEPICVCFADKTKEILQPYDGDAYRGVVRARR